MSTLWTNVLFHCFSFSSLSISCWRLFECSSKKTVRSSSVSFRQLSKENDVCMAKSSRQWPLQFRLFNRSSHWIKSTIRTAFLFSLIFDCQWKREKIEVFLLGSTIDGRLVSGKTFNCTLKIFTGQTFHSDDLNCNVDLFARKSFANKEKPIDWQGNEPRETTGTSFVFPTKINGEFVQLGENRFHRLLDTFPSTKVKQTFSPHSPSNFKEKQRSMFVLSSCANEQHSIKWKYHQKRRFNGSIPLDASSKIEICWKTNRGETPSF